MINGSPKIRHPERSAKPPKIRHPERSANGVPGQLAGWGRKRGAEGPRHPPISPCRPTPFNLRTLRLMMPNQVAETHPSANGAPYNGLGRRTRLSVPGAPGSTPPNNPKGQRPALYQPGAQDTSFRARSPRSTPSNNQRVEGPPYRGRPKPTSDPEVNFQKPVKPPNLLKTAQPPENKPQFLLKNIRK